MEHPFRKISPERRPGNVISTAELQRGGFATSAIRTLRRRGLLTSIRHGWYAGPEADGTVVSAVRSGGLLGCVSALVFHGAWSPLENEVHLYRTQHGRQFGPKRLTWCPTKHRGTLTRAVVPIGVAVDQARRCCSTEELLVLVESLVNRQRLTPAEAEDLLGPLAPVMAPAESGTETMVRMRLRARRIKVRSQVVITNVGRVDLLVGDRLVIEVDSQEHHSSTDAYHRDRRRDQRLIAMGYRVMRVTWEQVMFQWQEVEQVILRMVRSGEHRGRVTAW